MKKAFKSGATKASVREYRFDYAKARPNRFAASMGSGIHAVVLDKDVSRVFRSSEDVNHALRALIEAMPRSTSTPR